MPGGRGADRVPAGHEPSPWATQGPGEAGGTAGQPGSTLPLLRSALRGGARAWGHQEGQTPPPQLLASSGNQARKTSYASKQTK